MRLTARDIFVYLLVVIVLSALGFKGGAWYGAKQERAATEAATRVISTGEVKALWTVKTDAGVKRAPKYEEDARVKIKVAAELYPEYRWFGVWRDETGRWKREEF